MSRYRYWDLRENAGELVKEVIDPVTVQAFRRAEMATDIHMRTLELLLRRAAEDQQASSEEMWNECAKKLGYESVDALHADGFSISINNGKKSIQLRKRPGPAQSEPGEPT